MITQSNSDVIARAYKHATEYRASSSEQDLCPTVSTKELRRAFDIELQSEGRKPAEVIDLLVKAATPGLMRNTDPQFYGWVMGASSEVGIASDMLTSVWGQNAGIYQTAPSAAVAEEIAGKWLLDLFDLPRSATIGFTTGATMASFIGLAAARYEVLRRFGWNIETEGMFGAPEVQVFVGAEAHASVLAVLRYLGFGERNLIKIPTDSQGRIAIVPLRRAMKDLKGPSILVAQAGHINSGAFDRFSELADLAEEHNSWLHVDGAFGLWARGSRRYRKLADDIDRADSWAVDGHKWLQVPYDSGYAIVKNGDAHRQAMSMSASYLNRHPDDGRDPSEYGPELSRRARGFTTWAILQSLGVNGVEAMVDRHCDSAAKLASALAKIPGVRIMNEVGLNQLAVTFDEEYCNSQQLSDENLPVIVNRVENAIPTDSVIAYLRQQNRSFVSGADWKAHRIMRISIISEKTGPEEIDNLIADIRTAWQFVCERFVDAGQDGSANPFDTINFRPKIQADARLHTSLQTLN